MVRSCDMSGWRLCEQKGAGEVFVRKTGNTKERYLDVVKEDMQEVGKIKCLTEMSGESAVSTPDAKAKRRRPD